MPPLANGMLSLTGKLSVQVNSLRPQGDGVRGRVIHSRVGQLGTWLVHGTEEATEITNVEIKRTAIPLIL